ncbi:MAG: hypothetical protein V9E91_00920 [Burkholderiaceae bacterium]
MNENCHQTVTTPGQAINELESGKFCNLGKVLPIGSLEARKLSTNAVVFYWRLTIDGKTNRVSIGHYNSSAPPKSVKPTNNGFSIAAAKAAAAEMSAKHQANKDNGGYPALVAAESETKRRAVIREIRSCKTHASTTVK